MKMTPLSFFVDYKSKIIDPSYIPTTPLDTLKARLTAVWLFQDHDGEIVKKAQAFIKKTSVHDVDDLNRLKRWAMHINCFEKLEICSSYTTVSGVSLEYKLFFSTLEGSRETVHYHALYNYQDTLCCFISQTLPLIRVIGDPVLQKPGILFPKHASLEQKETLFNQIAHAKEVLIQTGGAGIAANQCAAIEKPYRFTIVGVFYDILAHATGVESRYPGTRFPNAMIMVNPVVTSLSYATQTFNHACLSIPCTNRCEVTSPAQLSVNYIDPLDEMRVKDVHLSGIDAIVLWHELTHIIDGKTYIDKTFESLPYVDLLQFKKMLYQEIQHRQLSQLNQAPDLSTLPFYVSVTVNDVGVPRLDASQLLNVLPNITDETLSGLLKQADSRLEIKLHANPKLPQTSLFATDDVSPSSDHRQPKVTLNKTY